MRYFDDAGSTSPASRLTSISARPIASRRRCAQSSSRASRQAAEADTLFFFGGSIGDPGTVTTPDALAGSTRTRSHAAPCHNQRWRPADLERQRSASRPSEMTDTTHTRRPGERRHDTRNPHPGAERVHARPQLSTGRIVSVPVSRAHLERRLRRRPSSSRGSGSSPTPTARSSASRARASSANSRCCRLAGPSSIRASAP